MSEDLKKSPAKRLNRRLTPKANPGKPQRPAPRRKKFRK